MKKLLIISTIFIASAVYFYSFALYGLNMWDEGVTPLGAVRVLNGEVPVEDFSAYAPARYYILAGLFKVFGTKLEVFRYFLVVITALMVVMLFESLLWLGGWFEGFVGSLLLVSAPAVYYNRFYGFTTILILFSLIALIKNGFSKKYRLVLGATLFLSYLFKSEVSVMGAITYTSLIFISPALRKEKFIWKTAPLGIYGVLAAFSYLFFHPHVSVNRFTHEYILKIFTMFNSWSTEFPPPLSLLWSGGVGFWGCFENWLFYLPVILYLFVLYRAFRKEIFDIKTSAMVCVAIMGCLNYSLVLWRTGLDNLIRCLPPFYMLAALLTGELVSATKKKAKKTNNLAGTVRECLKVAGIITVFTLFAFFLVDMNTRHGYYAGSVGAVNEGYEEKLDLKRAKIFVTDYQKDWITDAVTTFNEIGEKNITILALPFNPIWNFLLECNNPLPYDWILPGETYGKDEKWYIEKFREKEPDGIIYIDIPIDDRDERRFKNYAPNFYKLILGRYVYVTNFGPFWLYLKKAL